MEHAAIVFGFLPSIIPKFIIFYLVLVFYQLFPQPDFYTKESNLTFQKTLLSRKQMA